ASHSYTYDGFLLTSTTSTGSVAGTISRAYDNDFRPTSISLNGTMIATYGYDADSLLTQAGALTIARDAQNGLWTGSTLGVVTDSITYNAFAEPATYEARVSGTSVFAVQYTRDSLGRIATKTETIDGATAVYAYAYDAAGRLTDVTKDGTPVSHYTYDANGNRLTRTTSSGTVTA